MSSVKFLLSVGWSFFLDHVRLPLMIGVLTYRALRYVVCCPRELTAWGRMMEVVLALRFFVPVPYARMYSFRVFLHTGLPTTRTLDN